MCNVLTRVVEMENELVKILFVAGEGLKYFLVIESV